MKKKIMAIAIMVTDLKESVAFYTEKLGLKIKTSMDTYVDFELEGTTIALLDKSVADSLLGERLVADKNSAKPLILAWDAVDNVDSVFNELKSKGVSFIVEPKTMPWGQKVAYFTDPDGNIWEISQFS